MQMCPNTMLDPPGTLNMIIALHIRQRIQHTQKAVT